MQADTIKLVTTYATAVAIIVGGGAMLFVSRNEGTTDFALVLSGFIGAAITFLFGSETATRATRASERATANANAANVATNANGENE